MNILFFKAKKIDISKMVPQCYQIIFKNFEFWHAWMNSTYENAYILTKRRERNISKSKSGITYHYFYKYEYSQNQCESSTF